MQASKRSPNLGANDHVLSRIPSWMWPVLVKVVWLIVVLIRPDPREGWCH